MIMLCKVPFWLFITVTSMCIASLASAEQPLLSAGKIAISISYDDALNSQLDNALPSLNERGIKASFYVVPLSPAFQTRINEWKTVAQQGHELGNHTLFHACIKNKPGREWVDPYNALNDKTVNDMLNEVTVANTLLEALDGETVRTLTPPCFDEMAKDGNYIDAVKDQFVAIKSRDNADTSALIAPDSIGAQQIISFIESQPANITLINVLFHGVGGDHLSVSAKEHAMFLDYLVANSDKYWVDTYRNISLLNKAQVHSGKPN
jgi:hypothetical protein